MRFPFVIAAPKNSVHLKFRNRFLAFARASRRYLAVLLSMAVALVFMSTPAQSAVATCSISGALTVTSNVVTDGSLCAGSVTVPSGVTSISDNAFSDNVDLTSVTFPNSLTAIGAGAFLNATALTSVNFGTGLLTIGADAFNGATALISISLPTSVTSIGAHAFQGNTSLSSVTLNSNLVTIGSYAFSGDTSLTTINVPSSVSSIGSRAFQNDTSLATVTLNTGLVTISSFAFYGDTALTAITIPNTVTTIGSNAFLNASSIEVTTGDRTGYTFQNWNTMLNGSGASYTGAALNTYVRAGSTTLYPRWTINSYAVAYDAASFTTSGTAPASVQHEYNSTVTVLDNTGSLAKTGYTFDGWSTSSGGALAYAAGSTFTQGAGDVTLYAHGTINSYDVSYDGNGSTGGSVPATAGHNYATTVTVLGQGSLVRTGYHFVSWNTRSDGTGTNYSADDTFTMGTSAVPLYAKWGIDSYSISYNGNGNTTGAVPASTDTQTYNTLITVLGNTGTLASTGRRFTGWNTSADGTGSSYSADSTFNLGAANVTLYAQWSYCSTSGNINVVGTEIKYAYGSPANAVNRSCTGILTIPSNVNKIGGSTFGSNSGITAIDFGDSQVTSIGAQAFINNQSLTTLTIPNSVLTLDTGTFEYEYNLTTVTLGSGLTEIPQWAFHNDFELTSVTFSNWDTHINYHAFEGDTKLVLSMRVRPGYTLLGWNTLANGSGTTYTGAPLTEALVAGTELFPKWQVITSSVTYDGNGSTGGSLPTDSASPYLPNSLVTVLAQGSVVKTGNHFTGWNTQSDGNGSAYSATDTFTIGVSGVTLYAQWAPDSFDVSYDGNGSTGGSVPASLTPHVYNSSVTVLANSNSLVKTGYVFDGWATSSGGAVVYGASGSVTFTMGAAAVVLYAHWTLDAVYVSYNANGATGGSTPTDGLSPYTQGSLVTVLGNSGNLVKTGSTFDGWATSSGGAVAYAATDTFTIGSVDVVLYAHWRSSAYVVTAESPSTITYGAALPAIGYTSSPTSVSGDWTTAPTCAVYASTDTAFATPLTGVKHVGTYVTHCYGGVPTNAPTVTYVSGSLVIARSASTVTFGSYNYFMSTATSSQITVGGYCLSSRGAIFTVDGVVSPTLTTNASGVATLSKTLAVGAHEISVSITATSDCLGGYGSDVLYVSNNSTSPNGAGRYAVSGQGSVSFTYSATVQPAVKTTPAKVSGQMVWTTNAVRFKGTITGYTNSTPCAVPRKCVNITGTATKYTWNASNGTWVAGTTGVAFTLAVVDGSIVTTCVRGVCTSTTGPDSLGMTLPTETIAQESAAQQLTSGNIILQ